MLAMGVPFCRRLSATKQARGEALRHWYAKVRRKTGKQENRESTQRWRLLLQSASIIYGRTDAQRLCENYHHPGR